MARVFSFLGLIVTGLIVGDFIIHGSQVKQLAGGVQQVETPVINGLLGSTS
jgi:hypothetical protein